MSQTALQRKISKAMVDSAFDYGKGFFPISSFDELITSKRIDHLSDSYPKTALNDAQKVIAILLYMERFDCFEPLYNAGLRDVHLPLDLADEDDSDEEDSDDDDEDADDVVILESFHENRTFEVRSLDGPRFVREQWFFLSPTFGSPDLNEINTSCILPITFKSTEKRTGSYSRVWKVKIHPAHLVGYALPTHDNSEPIFALKQLISDSEKEFKQEEDALRRIHRLHHDHLIRVVSSFRRGHDYFFLFPWAEEGDLWRVWEKKSGEKRDVDIIKWVFVQIRGIASGVHKLHYPSDDPISEENCRHGDLRPENILLFLDDPSNRLGTLRITDVGLARIHELPTEKRVRGTKTSGGDQQYAPPKTGEKQTAEKRTGEKRVIEKRSRKYDIWSLGCIYLEFVVWLLGGIDEVNRFQKERKTTHSEYYRTSNSKPAELLPEVTRWIKDIRSDPRCQGDAPHQDNNAFRDLLNLVEDHLLVVDEKRRYDANELDAELGRILDKVEKNNGYLINKSIQAGFAPSKIQHQSRISKFFQK